MTPRLLSLVFLIFLAWRSLCGDVPAAQPNPDVTVHARPKPLPDGAVTHDWTSFLGPTHNAVSTETKLLKTWPQGGPVLLWEMKKGSGYSAPAIQGERLIFFHRVGDNEVAECLHPETGARLWQFSYAVQYQDRYGYNNGPRSSPLIDAGRVYTYGAEGILHCLKLETGEVVWKRDLSADFAIKQNFFGVGTTPLIEGNLLIVNVGAEKGPCVVALDKSTGKQVWGAGDEWGPSYATPVAADVQGKRRVFVLAGGESRPPTGGLLSIDPANGAVDFKFPWRSKTVDSVNAATPVVTGNDVFITATYQTGGALINVQPDFKYKLAWTTDELGSHFSTPICKNGYLYGFDGRHEQGAALACIEVKTGKTMWHEALDLSETPQINGQRRTLQLTQGRGNFLWADGAYLCLGEAGHLLWLELTPQGHKQLARAWLFAATSTWTPPVLSRGLLYVVQNDKSPVDGSSPRLLCYDLRAEK